MTKNKMMVVRGLIKSARELRSELENMLEVVRGEYTDEIHQLTLKLDNCERLIKEQYMAEVNRMTPDNMISNMMPMNQLKEEVKAYLTDAGFMRKERGRRSQADIMGVGDLSELGPLGAILGALMNEECECEDCRGRR